MKELRRDEMLEINGGAGAGVIILGGLATCLLADIVNEKVERETGKDIITHIKDGLTNIFG